MSILFNLKDYLNKVDEPTLQMQKYGLCTNCELHQYLDRSITTYVENKVVEEATKVWVESSAVPSTRDKEYPIYHSDMETTSAYVSATGRAHMLVGEYGQNRVTYAKFLHDYLEEYWK